MPEQATIDRLDLRRYLAHLPLTQRAVLVLRFYEDLSEAQIADLMDTPDRHRQEPSVYGPADPEAPDGG